MIKYTSKIVPRIQSIWKDPVLSKVISAIIIALSVNIYAIWEKIPVQELLYKKVEVYWIVIVIGLIWGFNLILFWVKARRQRNKVSLWKRRITSVLKKKGHVKTEDFKEFGFNITNSYLEINKEIRLFFDENYEKLNLKISPPEDISGTLIRSSFWGVSQSKRKLYETIRIWVEKGHGFL